MPGSLERDLDPGTKSIITNLQRVGLLQTEGDVAPDPQTMTISSLVGNSPANPEQTLVSPMEIMADIWRFWGELSLSYMRMWLLYPATSKPTGTKNLD